MNDAMVLLNPFRDNVVQDAWQSPADVTDIHRAVFKACLDGIDAASRGQPDSLLVHGPAGSGKTHLLTRLQRHLLDAGRSAPDRVLRCVFVYVRLQTSREHLWQHLRRRLVSDLMRRDQGVSQLIRLIGHQFAEHEKMTPRQAVMLMRVAASDPEWLATTMGPVFTDLALPRDLVVILEHLMQSRSIRDASAWLAGDSLPESVLENLGVSSDTEADREVVAREIVLGLCRLAPPTLPVVFCFDQVEALQRTPDDTAAFFQFGRLAADLHDADPNVFLLTCLQSALLPKFREAVREADFDRLAKRQATLETLTPSEIESLLAARLAALPSEQAKPSALWPFTSADVRALQAVRPAVARKVLAEAALKLDACQGRERRRISDADFLTRELDERFVQMSSKLGQGETRSAIVRGADVLAGLDRVEVLARDEATESAGIDVVLEDRESKQRIALSVREEADGRSLRPRLDALNKHFPRKDGTRLVIVRDPRVPLPKAPKAREHLASLQKKGALVLEPSVDALAALATLAEILADAKSGDLANDGETLQENVVLAWMRSLALRDPTRLVGIEQLVDDMFGGPAVKANPETEALEKLSELVAREQMLDVDAAVAEVGVTVERLLALARQRPHHYLVLEGPPTLILDMAGVVTSTLEAP